MQYLVSAMLLIVAVIHLLPVVGVLGTERLEILYGITVADSNLEILMRHRAVLFGLLGGLLGLAAFLPSYQTVAFIAGFVSVLSFFWLTWSVGGFNSQIQRVVVADVFALICLITGCIAKFLLHRGV